MLCCFCCTRLDTGPRHPPRPGPALLGLLSAARPRELLLPLAVSTRHPQGWCLRRRTPPEPILNSFSRLSAQDVAPERARPPHLYAAASPSVPLAELQGSRRHWHAKGAARAAGRSSPADTESSGIGVTGDNSTLSPILALSPFSQRVCREASVLRAGNPSQAVHRLHHFTASPCPRYLTELRPVARLLLRIIARLN